MTMRDPSVEAWRIICMLTVVISHVLVANHMQGFNYLQWHVPGFLWITGYYGMRFNWKKVFLLVLSTYMCYWMTIPFRGYAATSDYFVKLMLPHGGWFLPFYIMLMFLSPLFEAAIKDRESHRKIFYLLLFLAIWGWLPSLLEEGPHVSMMRVPGMSDNGVLLAIVVYMTARILSKHDDWIIALPRIMKMMMFGMLIVCCGLVGRRGGYGNVICLCAACCGFYAVKGLRIPAIVGKVAVWLAPSMWGVYVLHECCVKSWQKIPSCIGGGVGAVILWAATLFVVCCLIDIIRRGLMAVLAKGLRGVFKHG